MSFTKDKAGKISDKILSPYGRGQLNTIQGAKLYFTDTTLTVKGDKLVDPSGKVAMKLNNDRAVNKVLYKIM